MALWSEYRGRELRGVMPSGQVVPLGRTPGRLPFAGGRLDQPAYVLAAFEVMEEAEAKLRDAIEGEGAG